ncbi:Cyclopropane-fatty-acyl-phospholipid synthase, plant type [Serinicoccus hydrothermalis]|uniref:Cyclopropane-fatty-acyl-phospholipid synthase, plant type n=1 Tax=Serinicoccus hydrothermalis TaxID=1758689 RepID=A0A1B1NCJ5_9MICO|nr:cyclopropane-fatty-acyl-phospholipid synthase family protein [Serinicoccus hydrothermalis]ANS79134.1 Cyclopropane-fatty-acyl-phospholipid synthase, plant type [Serinicoccus hydrothermalis]
MNGPAPIPVRTDALGRARAAAARRVMDTVLRRVDVEVLDAHTPTPGPDRPAIVMHDPESFYARLGAWHKVAVGEGYTEGDWSPAPGQDLAAVLRPFADRLSDGMPSPLRKLRRLADQALPRSTRNTLSGSRANIEAHYDLSNEMFAAFLDDSLSYSCALFDENRPWEEQTLEDAQLRKTDAALDRAGVGEGTRVLEIGTGWGTLAIRAAQRGAEVVTITLSREQAQLAEKRLAEAGVAERVEVRLQDYREVEGDFDAVVSIEMVEAVGEEFWPTYFGTIDDRLAPGGTAVVQAITLPHDRHLSTRNTYGWIQKYIFPGGALPSVDAIERTCTAHTDLRVRSVHAFGQHYAETLRRWRTAFLESWPTIEDLGFDDRFRRIWEFYLAYCQAGFSAGAIDVGQIVLNRPPRGPVAAG